jgi:two-component system, chemotaxis family, chemotaxis protein CheY
MAMNVLVVDDSALVRLVFLRNLRLSGVELGEVYQAANGQEALDSLEANEVDMLFLDINMPVMDGEKMLESIRRSTAWADLPVVMLSVEASLVRIDHLKSMGARFLRKPFAPQAIREVVAELTTVHA